MRTNGFTFTSSVYDMIQSLECKESRLKMYEAAIDYGLNGNIADFSEDHTGLSKWFFLLIIKLIDDNKSRAEQLRKKRSEAGKLGGAPKGNKNACKK